MNIKLLIIAVVVSLVAAAPITAALDRHTDSLKIERSEKQQLQLRLDSIENKLEKEKTKRENKENKLQNKQQENQELKQDKQRLRRKLQTKREREERQRLAALREQEEQQQPEPEPEPEPVTTTHAVGCENYRSAVSQYDWDTDTMMRIMSAESGCNPTNHNYQDNHGSCMGSYGLFQIGCVHGYSVAHLENPSNNIAAAYQIWQSSGYSAWTTY